MINDYSFYVLERLLLLKKYTDKNDVMNTGTMITRIICQDNRMSAGIKVSYKEAMKKLNILSFEEMKEIIGILNSFDDENPPNDEVNSDVFDDGTFDYEAGVSFYKNKEFEKAFSSFQKATRFGNPKALHGYGLCLYYGLGTKVDKIKAIKQFAAASDMGVKEADKMMKYILNRTIDENSA